MTILGKSLESYSSLWNNTLSSGMKMIRLEGLCALHKLSQSRLKNILFTSSFVSHNQTVSSFCNYPFYRLPASTGIQRPRYSPAPLYSPKLTRSR
jgi:hypothetical protein